MAPYVQYGLAAQDGLAVLAKGLGIQARVGTRTGCVGYACAPVWHGSSRYGCWRCRWRWPRWELLKRKPLCGPVPKLPGNLQSATYFEHPLT